MWIGGIIGIGGVGEAHLRNLLSFPEVKVEAVADVRKEAIEYVESNFGIKGFLDYCKLLKLNLDFVYICTPNDLHPEMVIEAARSGVKAIFCEKPLAVTLEAADKIISEVKNTEADVLVNYSFPFASQTGRMIEIFERGELGELVFCWSRRLKGSSFYIQEPDAPRTGRLASMGGWLIHHTTHDLEWLMRIGGEVKEVYGKTFSTNPDPLAIESTWAIITFREHGIGIVGDSLDGFRDKSMGIQGKQGCITLNNYNKVCFRAKGMDKSKEMVIQKENNYLNATRHFLNVMKNETKPLVGLKEAREVLKVAFCIKQSSDEERVVSLDDFSKEQRQTGIKY